MSEKEKQDLVLFTLGYVKGKHGLGYSKKEAEKIAKVLVNEWQKILTQKAA